MNNSNPAIALYKALHKKRAYTKLYWDVANEIGVYEALLIEIVERWCELNQEKGSTGYYHDGEWWTSATYEEWANRYPALGGKKSIQNRLLALEKAGHILSGQFTRGSQVKYYRVNPESIGNLLLTGTTTEQTGIVQNRDGAIQNRDGAIQNRDGAIQNRDGAIQNRDGHLYINQINVLDHSKDQSNIPPTTPKNEGGEANQRPKATEQTPTAFDNSLDPEPPPIPPHPPLPRENDSRSYGQSDNSAYMGNSNLSPDGKSRPFNQITGNWKSISSDPWMQNQNPIPDFKEWVHRDAIASGKPSTLANAAAQIRNNYLRAADLWEDYQAELRQRKKVDRDRLLLQQQIQQAQEAHTPPAAAQPQSQEAAYTPPADWLEDLRKVALEQRNKPTYRQRRGVN